MQINYFSSLHIKCKRPKLFKMRISKLLQIIAVIEKWIKFVSNIRFITTIEEMNMYKVLTSRIMLFSQHYSVFTGLLLTLTFPYRLLTIFTVSSTAGSFETRSTDAMRNGEFATSIWSRSFTCLSVFSAWGAPPFSIASS